MAVAAGSGLSPGAAWWWPLRAQLPVRGGCSAWRGVAGPDPAGASLQLTAGPTSPSADDPQVAQLTHHRHRSLRACASGRSCAAASAAVPAVVGPGAADQSATDDGGIGQQPELADQP